MKTSDDPRHKHRIQLLHLLFAYSFNDKRPKSQKLVELIPHLADIDRAISAAAPQWPLDKISKIDLATLRLAVYELRITKKEPAKVIIDEAIELAKEFGTESSPGFINGVLGTIMHTGEPT